MFSAKIIDKCKYKDFLWMLVVAPKRLSIKCLDILYSVEMPDKGGLMQ